MTLPLEAVLTVDTEPSLYSGPGRDGLLRLTNHSPLSIEINPVDAGGSAQELSAPLSLHVPAGTLSPTCLIELRAIEGWDATVYPNGRVDGPNRWDVVRLNPRTTVTIPPGSDTVVQLHGLAAAARGRARHTRLVVDYAVEQIDANGARQPLIGSRALVLYVMPWHHSPAHLHLAAGVWRGAEVLNRSDRANEIELRISPDAVLGSVDLVGGQTEVRVSWDVGAAETRWWALCTPAEADASRVELHWMLDPGRFDDDESVPEPILDSDVWVSPTSATWGVVVPADVSLREGDHLAIRISELFTAHRTGPANLYVDLVGVGDGAGGFVSGTFVLPVHKQAHRWEAGDGLTIVAGPDEPALQVRDEFGRLALRLTGTERGHALQLFVKDPAHPELDIVGAQLSSDGDAFLGRGLSMGGPLDIGSSLRLTDSAGRLAVTTRRGQSTGGGTLHLGPPDDGRDYGLDVRANRLVASGDVGVAGELSVGGSLAAQGDASVAGRLTITGGASVTGRLDVGDLRVDGTRPMAILDHIVTINQDNPTNMRDEWWQAMLAGSPKAALTIAGIVVQVPIRLFSSDGQWKLEPDPEHVLAAVPFAGLPLRIIVAAATGSGKATVLYVRRTLLARMTADSA